MIYTDYTHMIADSLPELHVFAKELDIKRGWFEGKSKGHPHYDIPKRKLQLIKQLVKDGRIIRLTTRELIIIIRQQQQRQAA